MDIVLSWMSKAHLYAGPAAWLAKIDAIWFQHGTPETSFLGQCLKHMPAKAILCSSHATKELQSTFTPDLPIYVIYPSVELNEYNPTLLPSMEDVRKELGLPSKCTIVGSVARLQRWKGVHVFLEAALRVSEADPDAHFVVVGGSHFSEPLYPEELKQQALQYGIADKVSFAGHQAHVQRWVQAFDILVHSSIGTEPFGMVIIEGMALGKAVIASESGGPLEIVKHGENGVLVPSNDAVRLSTAILKLMEDREYCSQIGRGGLIRAQAFSSERLSEEIAHLLENMRIGA